MIRLASRTMLGSAAAIALIAGPLSAQNPPSVAVSGVSYAQYGYQVSDTASHQNNFALTRAYVNVTGRFPSGVLTRVTADVYSSGTSLVYRLKYAYAAYTPTNSRLTYKLGLIHTAWLDWEEALWDYRMQGTMPIERNGYATSADFGAGIDGAWSQDLVNAQLAFVNGEGYGGGNGDRRKDVQARASVRLVKTDDVSRVGGLRLTGYAGIGEPTTGGTRNRFAGMLSYHSKQFTLAGQFVAAQDSVTGDATVAARPKTTGRVISGYGVAKFGISGVAAVGRVDLADPNTSAAGDRQTRIIAGLSYQVAPQLRLLADVDHVAYEGALSPAQRAAQTQALLQMQFTF